MKGFRIHKDRLEKDLSIIDGSSYYTPSKDISDYAFEEESPIVFYCSGHYD